MSTWFFFPKESWSQSCGGLREQDRRQLAIVEGRSGQANTWAIAAALRYIGMYNVYIILVIVLYCSPVCWKLLSYSYSSYSFVKTLKENRRQIRMERIAKQRQEAAEAAAKAAVAAIQKDQHSKEKKSMDTDAADDSGKKQCTKKEPAAITAPVKATRQPEHQMRTHRQTQTGRASNKEKLKELKTNMFIQSVPGKGRYNRSAHMLCTKTDATMDILLGMWHPCLGYDHASRVEAYIDGTSIVHWLQVPFCTLHPVVLKKTQQLQLMFWFDDNKVYLDNCWWQQQSLQIILSSSCVLWLV